MGYMGLGMQRWISNMKPRKFLGKRSKPDGGGGETDLKRDINEYYHLKHNDLKNILKKKYTSGFRKELNSEMNHENRRQRIFAGVSLLIGLIVLIIAFWYVNSKIELF